MTTIVCDSRVGLMGADTHTDWGMPARKLWRHKTKGIFGCAGDYTAAVRFQNWILRGKKKPDQIIGENAEGFEALQLYKGLVLVWDGAMQADECLQPYFAVGTGAKWALGAMDHGATIHEALEIAAKRDSGTKAPFTYLEV